MASTEKNASEHDVRSFLFLELKGSSQRLQQSHERGMLMTPIHRLHYPFPARLTNVDVVGFA